MKLYSDIFKRLFDIVISLIAICSLSPLLVILIFILYIHFRENPFFLQIRPGRNEKLFKLVKFKTMNNLRDIDGRLLPNQMRITKTGAWLRKWSLDELPQFINVLMGDMSIVGPRPLLEKYLPLYSEEQRKRHNVKPGITGWAQVKGRNALSWKEKFEYDVYYADHISFLFDIRIILMTIVKVLKSEGINASENITMPPFDGHN